MSKSLSARLVTHHCGDWDFASVSFSGKVKSKTPMRKIIILDVSASMGKDASLLVNQVFPSLLTPSENVDLILFSTNQEHYVTDALRMTKQTINQGSTYMSKVPSLVTELISKHRTVQIVIVTDGDVADREAVFRSATQLSKTIDPSAVVQVLPIRFLNSSYANPDTKAVMSVGMMATDKVEPCDVNTSNRNYMEQIGSLARNFFTSTCEMATLRSAVPCLCRFPGDVLQTSLFICDQNQLLVSSHGRSWEELDIHILDGDNVVPLTIERKEVESEDNIREYLTILNNRARIQAVMDVDSQSLFDFVHKLTTYFTLKEEVTSGGKAAKPSTRLRLQQIKRRIERSSKSVLASISQLKNRDAVKSFNSQQMASFLRQDDSSRASKALAKRQGRIYEGKEIDFESVANQDLRSFVSKLPQYRGLLQHSDLTASFYSTETMGDMFKALLELSPDVIQNLCMEDMLLLVGGVGLPITAQVRTLVDPWIFRADEVHTDCFLSQPDWAAARVQSKGHPLLTPGTRRPITGVVPLAQTPEDETLLEFYYANLPSLARMQSSVAMMGILSDLPFADIALQASTLLCLAEQVVTGSCSSREFLFVKKLMDSLRRRTTKIKAFDELRTNLCPEYFTGTNDITGVLKPLIIWLENPTMELIPELIRLETRWRVKTHANMLDVDGDAVLAGWMDLNPTHNHPLQPLFVAEPEDIKFYDQVDQTRLVEELKSWITWKPQSLYTLYEMTQSKTVEEFNSRPIHAISNLWMTYLAVETFHFPKIVDTDTRTLKTRLLVDETEIVTYLKSIVRSHFEQEYKSALSLKKRQEFDAMRAQHLDELCKVDDLEKFLEMLNNHFTPRDSDVITALTSPHCVKNLEKIWIFTVGKFPNSSRAVWNEGSARRLTPKENKQLRMLFESTQRGQRMWVEFVDVRKSYGCHKYRGGNSQANRHGYSNDCPSFWALGFESPDDMRDAYTDRQWNEYLQLCSRFGLKKTYLA
jgi:hypothetical protein